MTPHRNDPRELIRYALGAAAFTAVVLWTLYLAREALLLIYIAGLVAIGLGPLVGRIEQTPLFGRRGCPRWTAILLIYLVLAGVVVGIGILVVPPLIEQAGALWTALPRLLEQLRQRLIELGLINRSITVRQAVAQSPVGGTDAVGGVIAAVFGVVGGLFGLITVLIVAFYLLLDSESLVRTFVRAFPADARARADAACRRISTKVSAWLGGQLLLAGVIGTSAAIGLYALGVPYFYVLALIAGVGEVIPVVGPLLAAIPAVGVAFSVSPALALAVGVFFLIQQQLENHVLVPRVMSRQVGISAAVVMASLIIGSALLGIVGAILAVPTAAIVQVLYEELTSDVTGSPGTSL